MAGAFDDVALQYVLADDSESAAQAAATASSRIEESANKRVMVGQWVSSINRWITPEEVADDDFIARGKAYDFLADTLQGLKKDTLRVDQIKLLIGFFGALFASDHRAGVSGAAKAMKELFHMRFFQPTLGNDIVQSISKLGSDFQRQLPGTRLRIYELLLDCLQNPEVANDLGYRHGNTCGFMTDLVEICRNERDPDNLIVWFAILRAFMQSFSPSSEVTTEVFKTFSAYFPISMRASATSSGVTAADLKKAVRGCFSSHQQLASHAIPYLIGRLDQGDAVTVAVKVDILQTLEACVAEYGHTQQSVVPFIDSIWGSLKYEVRNGEVPETIEATLKVITSLTRRLVNENLTSFFSTAWTDISDDLSAPKYSSPAGQLLVAIAGASVPAFNLASSKTLPIVQSTLRQTKSVSHMQDLLTIINSLLLVRSHLVQDATSEDLSANGLSDKLFDDSLFASTYEPQWNGIQDGGKNAIEQLGLLKKVMEGLAALVDQRSSGFEHRRLCTDAACQQIFSWLARPSIISPLKGTTFLASASEDATLQIRESAVLCLKNALPRYPEGFQQLLDHFLTTAQEIYDSNTLSTGLVPEIRSVSSALSEIGCSTITPSTLSNSITLLRALLQGLRWFLSKQAPPKYWTALISSIHIAILRSLKALDTETTADASTPITKEMVSQCSTDLELARDGQDGLEADELAWEGATRHHRLLAYCVNVVQQMYRRFTALHHHTDQTPTKQCQVGLSQDFTPGEPWVGEQQDVALHHVGLLATSVLRLLTSEEQTSLRLDEEAFTLFHGDDQTSEGSPYRNIALGKTVEISPMSEYRTAPLTMGILQGLFPAAITYEYHVNALENICNILTIAPSPCSDMTRAALDSVIATLSNKFVVKGAERIAKRAELSEMLLAKFKAIWAEDAACSMDAPTAVRIFRSILHYLAGDVARFQGKPTDNGLLKFVCAVAPYNKTMGRELAQNFDVLVRPIECLQGENHAVVKRLSQEWTYYQATQPYLNDCFPKPGNEEADQEQRLVNRAIASLAILRHLQYEHYASDVEQVVRICIRSLSTFASGPELHSCLHVLHTILDKDPDSIKEHTRSLVKAINSVYKQGLEQARARRSAHLEHACRQLALSFLARLPSAIPNEQFRHLAPHAKIVQHLATVACGDPVREIRRGAPNIRKEWEKVMV